MITLYHCSDARSFRPLWTLEEMELPYRLEMLPFPPRAAAPAYKTLNPLGTVPLMIDGAVRMTESAAICQYLAARHGPAALSVQPHEADYGAFLNALHFGEATLTFPLTLVLRYDRFEDDAHRLPQVAADYSRWFLSRLRGFGEDFAGPFVCGGRFTVADISVGYALLLAAKLGLDRQFSEPVATYWERLQAREGYKRADVAQLNRAAEQGVSLTDFDPAGRFHDAVECAPAGGQIGRN